MYDAGRPSVLRVHEVDGADRIIGEFSACVRSDAYPELSPDGAGVYLHTQGSQPPRLAYFSLPDGAPVARRAASGERPLHAGGGDAGTARMATWGPYACWPSDPRTMPGESGHAFLMADLQAGTWSGRFAAPFDAYAFISMSPDGRFVAASGRSEDLPFGAELLVYDLSSLPHAGTQDEQRGRD
jgi:hypothetical protein